MASRLNGTNDRYRQSLKKPQAKRQDLNSESRATQAFRNGSVRHEYNPLRRSDQFEPNRHRDPELQWIAWW